MVWDSVCASADVQQTTASPAFIANARMYSVNPAAKAGWSELFAWVAHRSHVPLAVIDHAYPAPLSDLWSRRDLACAFMCGYPFARAPHRPIAVAAPLTKGSPKRQEPVYATKLIVRADSSFLTLPDTFGGRLGFTVSDSQSGYNAVRHHLLAFRTSGVDRLYAESVGPLYTPRRVLEAVVTGAIDVGPLDSYALELMMRHEPELGERIRVVATTAPAPIPLLIASPECPPAVVAALRAAFLDFGKASDTVDLRDRLCLDGFAAVDPDAYALTMRWDAEATAAGYPHPC